MSKSDTIREHVRRIETQEYLIPNFQREFIWKKSRIIKLLENILSCKPIGGLLIWKSSINLTSKGVSITDEKKSNLYVLDGQQRLTALYIIMKAKLPYYYTKKEVEKTLKEFQIIIDFKNFPEYELLFKEKITNPTNQIKVSDLLLDGYDYEGIDNKYYRLCIDLRSNFTKKEINYEQFEGDDVATAISIFDDINTAGIKLTGAELLLAYISAYWGTARDEMKKAQEKIKVDNFELSIDMLTQLILACLVKTNNSNDKTLTTENMKDEVINCWEKITKKDGALSKTIAFFKKYKVINIKEIANKPSIIPIVFCHYHFELDEITEKKLAAYFFNTQTFIWFRTNVNTRITEHLRILEDAINQEERTLIEQLEKCIDIVTAGGQALNEDFLRMQTKDSSLFYMMKWTFRNNNAVCLDEIQTINLDSPNYSFEKDHIFPKALLKPKYIGSEGKKMIDSIANMCFLKSSANRSKSDKSADIFLKDCKEKNPLSLKKQCIPENEELWKIENFYEFLKERRKLIVEDINEFIKSLNDENIQNHHSNDIVSMDQILEEINSDEDDDTEFKSSLRWDYNKDEVNKSLEKNVIKNICGFANHIGGNLYIGVDDFNKVLGIEKDIEIFGSKDKFSLHLTQIIKQYFDTAFFNYNIDISFPTINNKERLDRLEDDSRIKEDHNLFVDEQGEQIDVICLIHVKPSKELRFIKETNKNGQVDAKCYIRSGPSTTALQSEEVINYNNKRNDDQKDSQ